MSGFERWDTGAQVLFTGEHRFCTLVTEVAAHRLTYSTIRSWKEKIKIKEEEETRRTGETHRDAVHTNDAILRSRRWQVSLFIAPQSPQARHPTLVLKRAPGRPSNVAQSDVGSNNSWDDMDCCGLFLGYLCGGPRTKRERFQPWKQEPQRVTPYVHHTSQRGHVTAASLASPNANEVTLEYPGESQLDRAVQCEMEMARVERDASEKRVWELQDHSHDPRNHREHKHMQGFQALHRKLVHPFRKPAPPFPPAVLLKDALPASQSNPELS
ncbi:hypothetical protein BS17DRAFT_811527 [Gyrodon lividus]|nr:hypothetical protein BS17DRAFT_811527 [Gyrodon lividus]